MPAQDARMITAEEVDSEGWIRIKNDPNVSAVRFTDYNDPPRPAVIFEVHTNDGWQGSTRSVHLIDKLKGAGIDAFRRKPTYDVQLYNPGKLNDAMIALDWPGNAKKPVQDEFDAMQNEFRRNQERLSA